MNLKTLPHQLEEALLPISGSINPLQVGEFNLGTFPLTSVAHLVQQSLMGKSWLGSSAAPGGLHPEAIPWGSESSSQSCPHTAEEAKRSPSPSLTPVQI